MQNLHSRSFTGRASTLLTTTATAAIVALLIGAQPAHAQSGAFWSLTLDTPNQTLPLGTGGGSAVYTGTITSLATNTADLNFNGDSFTTGLWDASLSVQESPALTDFLNNVGFLSPGQSFSNALFIVSWTGVTPPSGTTPYNGSFLVSTDGLPPSLASTFTLRLTPSGGGNVVPESSPAVLLLLGGAGMVIGSRLARARRYTAAST